MRQLQLFFRTESSNRLKLHVLQLGLTDEFTSVTVQKEHFAVGIMLNHGHAAERVVKCLTSDGRWHIDHVKRRLELKPRQSEKVLVAVHQLEGFEEIWRVKSVEFHQLQWHSVASSIYHQLPTLLFEHIHKPLVQQLPEQRLAVDVENGVSRVPKVRPEDGPRLGKLLRVEQKLGSLTGTLSESRNKTLSKKL